MRSNETGFSVGLSPPTITLTVNGLFYNFSFTSSTWSAQKTNNITLMSACWTSIYTNPSNSYMICADSDIGVFNEISSELRQIISSPNLSLVSGNFDGSLILGATSSVYYSSLLSLNTWVELVAARNPGGTNWKSMQCVGNSTAANYTFILCESSLYLYTSSDGALIKQTGGVLPDTANYSFVASNVDGSVYMACTSGTTGTADSGNVYIYSSSASSAWQIPSGLPTEAAWSCVSCSSDGSIMAACVRGGSIYISQDTGFTWTIQTKASLGDNGIGEWQCINVTALGNLITVGAYGGLIYIYSVSNSVWKQFTILPTTGKWSSLASNSDGTKIYATAQFDNVYITASSQAANL
jgi:hypothetical protein